MRLTKSWGGDKTNKRSISIFVLAAILHLLALAGQAKVSVPAILGDHMVIQSGVPVNVWGWASPGEQVSVSWGQQSASTRADEKGNWLVRLNPVKAGTKADLVVNGQANSIKLMDVVAGEVWVACGQSNMALGLKGARGGKEAAAEANYPNIRFFAVSREPSNKPKADCGGSWKVCSPDSAEGFSAVGFFFARKLQHDIGVPVGVINASLNGTTCETWTRRDILVQDKGLKDITDGWDAKAKAYDPALEAERYSAALSAYRIKLKDWEAADANAKANGQKGGKKPQIPAMIESPLESNNYPGNCYNGMILPLLPLAVKGVLWYQGESNAGFPDSYTRLLSAMIADWRAGWHNDNLVFLIVQLPWRDKGQDGNVMESWALMREAQSKVLSLPATAMIVTVDNREVILHPTNKQPVGERLAKAAAGIAYGAKAPYRGPVFSHYVSKGDTLILKFTHTDGGLVASGDSLTGFSVAGEDRVFKPAQARIVGDRVMVRADGVPSPRSVRYAWMAGQWPSLYNGVGLPAEPFRTDNWRMDAK
jgi:sialate O-acetylesterase